MHVYPGDVVTYEPYLKGIGMINSYVTDAIKSINVDEKIIKLCGTVCPLTSFIGSPRFCVIERLSMENHVYAIKKLNHVSQIQLHVFYMINHMLMKICPWKNLLKFYANLVIIINISINIY